MNNLAEQPGYSSRTASNAQANLVRQAKYPVNGEDGKFQTRNWSLFFFFRIMRRVEMNATKKRLSAALEALSALPEGAYPDSGSNFVEDKDGSPLNKLKLDLAYPNVLNGGLVAHARAEADAKIGPEQEGSDARSEDAPARAFLDWLKVLVLGDAGPIREGAASLADSLAKASGAAQAPADAPVTPLEPAQVEQMMRELATSLRDGKLGAMLPLARYLRQVLDHVKADYQGVMGRILAAIDAPPSDSPHGPLARMVLYEFLRQGAPIFLAEEIQPVLRSEAQEDVRLKHTDKYDQTPITMTFSFPGLRALKMHPNTLASFPEAFKEGMAARARRLGDIGPSAPENWEGELGLRTVHGYFTGGSNLERKKHLSERFWKDLRAEIGMFNDPTAERGSDLRAWIGLLFRLVGLEIVHIELGQDPYHVVTDKDHPDGEVEPILPRVEHFGFRDGLSQPFLDLRLGDALPGGGTAGRLGTWTPVAQGEIFLDREDETGQKHVVPLDKDLREGSTYLVFRKLEQDVEGFRAFLEQQRPNDKTAQDRLAAQFYGRWRNGTSLVRSPHTERSTANAVNDARLNDFRYGADDPQGRKCPLGAHVRRANPRDTGGRNDVRHHRILRRGIAYGGPLLGDDQADDGEKRGILFVAANASIDLQFEVVQGDWINGGEFLGQAGLGRCPISGANDGSSAARFLEAGAVAPVTGIPSFVTMRGGDYFFAPGIKALRRIAEGSDFRVETKDVPFRGHSMNDVATPSLFTDDRLKRYWQGDLSHGRPLRVAPRTADGKVAAGQTVAFVGRYDQVKKVLSNDPTPDGKGVYYSVEPYLTAGRRISRGEDFLVGTDAAGSNPPRERLRAVLQEGWNTLAAHLPSRDPTADVREAARERLDAAVRCAAGTRRIDLVDDLAAQAAYAVIKEVFGIGGPRWLSELAVALPFARQHVGDLPRDWIAAFKGELPADPGLKTMQVWSTFLVADLIGNHLDQQPLHVLARQAGSEMLNHIDQTLAERAALGPVEKARNLIEAFLFNGQRLAFEAKKEPPETRSDFFKHYNAFGNRWMGVYQKDLAIILLEILGSTVAVVPLTFASVMTTLLNLRIDLSLLLPRLDDAGVAQIVYEAERLKPNAAVRVRRCAHASPPEDGLPIAPGDLVAAVIAAANMDRYVFWKPEVFSLGKADPLSDSFDEYVDPEEKHPRDPSNYLLFGVEGSNKICWGRHLVAMPILQECIYACGRLQGLRRVAGRRGEPQTLGEVTVGLAARFTRILPKDVRD